METVKQKIVQLENSCSFLQMELSRAKTQHFSFEQYLVPLNVQISPVFAEAKTAWKAVNIKDTTSLKKDIIETHKIITQCFDIIRSSEKETPVEPNSSNSFFIDQLRSELNQISEFLMKIDPSISSTGDPVLPITKLISKPIEDPTSWKAKLKYVGNVTLSSSIFFLGTIRAGVMEVFSTVISFGRKMSALGVRIAYSADPTQILKAIIPYAFTALVGLGLTSLILLSIVPKKIYDYVQFLKHFKNNVDSEGKILDLGKKLTDITDWQSNLWLKFDNAANELMDLVLK